MSCPPIVYAISRYIECLLTLHSDIEDTLLTLMMSAASRKKFGKLDVKRVYFGNWLRDYSQAVDVSFSTPPVRRLPHTPHRCATVR